MNRKKIVILDEQSIVRESIRALLVSDAELDVAADEDGRGTIDSVVQGRPALVVMDPSGVNGLEAIKVIRSDSPETKILVLTTNKSDEFIMGALQAGADGFLLKDCPSVELRLAVKNLLNGRSFISPEISGRMVHRYMENRKGLKTSTRWELLTDREKGVLKLVAEGYKNREIADFLCISVKTVEKHRANLMGKLDVHKVSALTSLAMEKGLIVK
ncbi:MAG TPA: response regulator transcription factor [Thermodesulfobacteriota bacterium]|nr:response regulator transcription factor [Thermodesulfobacteriota bacterium]